jgi:hypothetical protein
LDGTTGSESKNVDEIISNNPYSEVNNKPLILNKANNSIKQIYF